MVTTRSARLTSSTRSWTSSDARAGFEQGLQHQPGATLAGIGAIKEAQFLLDGEAINDASTFGRGTQAGPVPGGFEHRLALGVVHALAHEDGGDGRGGALDPTHEGSLLSLLRDAN